MNPDADIPPSLQFESAIPRGAQPDQHTVDTTVTCSGCQQAIAGEYFDVNGQSVCRSCRDALAQHAETPRGLSVLAKACLFGVVAAILGAVLYYAVVAITNFEIGFVAIAIGYMVGYAIRLATANRGGRRFQILAVVLTYWAVGLADTSLLVGRPGAEDEGRGQTATAPPNTDSAPPIDEPGEMNPTAVVARLLVFSFLAPVLIVGGSMPGGLISAAIIVFGILQAWRMTGVPPLVITGPYRIAPSLASA